MRPCRSIAASRPDMLTPLWWLSPIIPHASHPPTDLIDSPATEAFQSKVATTDIDMVDVDRRSSLSNLSGATRGYATEKRVLGTNFVKGRRDRQFPCVTMSPIVLQAMRRGKVSAFGLSARQCVTCCCDRQPRRGGGRRRHPPDMLWKNGDRHFVIAMIRGLIGRRQLVAKAYQRSGDKSVRMGNKRAPAALAPYLALPGSYP